MKKEYVKDLNKKSDWGIVETNKFKISNKAKPRVWTIDNFYDNPDEVREFALGQYYWDDEGYVGMRTRKQFEVEGIKERFEKIMNSKITKWNDYGMNGRFQSNIAGSPTAHHCDSQ